jgi:hypothetical protein
MEFGSTVTLVNTNNPEVEKRKKKENKNLFRSVRCVTFIDGPFWGKPFFLLLRE